MILKTNLHLHTADDTEDGLSYSTFQAIDEAEKLNMNVLALTCHRKFVYKKEYELYAEQKGILLIKGIEAKIEKKHVVILNLPTGKAGCNKEVEKIRTFEELKNYKKQNPQIFILAPHPFVWSAKSLGKKLIRHIDIFDAIELSIFSNMFFNFNKKAGKIARKHNKPTVATSDTHDLNNLKRGFCIIETEERTPEAIFKAIKEKKIKNKIIAMSLLKMTEHIIKSTARELLQKFKKI